MAGDEGFEPPISGPEPGALPLGQSPLTAIFYLLIDLFSMVFGVLMLRVGYVLPFVGYIT